MLLIFAICDPPPYSVRKPCNEGTAVRLTANASSPLSIFFVRADPPHHEYLVNKPGLPDLNAGKLDLLTVR